jgi:osmoprotectant transport system ATP-binding protein
MQPQTPDGVPKAWGATVDGRSDVIAPAAHLAVERLAKSYGPVRALSGVTLAVAGGCCLALVGESGAGKSTLLRCINRIEEPDSGRVLIAGEDVSRRDPVELRRSIGYVPQEGGLLPHWRVRRNAALVPSLRRRSDADARADEALALVGLDPATYGDRWPHELSGGQRQRVAVARALAGGQSLLLLDEPFGALDAITRSELQRMLLAVRAQRPLTIVLVTHDLREAALLSDAVAVLRSGRVEQVAPPGVLLREPATPYVAELLARAGSTAAGSTHPTSSREPSAPAG